MLWLKIISCVKFEKKSRHRESYDAIYKERSVEDRQDWNKNFQSQNDGAQKANSVRSNMGAV